MKQILILLIFMIGCTDKNSVQYIEKEFINKTTKLSELTNISVYNYERNITYPSGVTKITGNGIAIEGMNVKGIIKRYDFNREELETVLKYCTNIHTQRAVKELVKWYNIKLTNGNN